jgi:hypothetical protein
MLLRLDFRSIQLNSAESFAQPMALLVAAFAKTLKRHRGSRDPKGRFIYAYCERNRREVGVTEDIRNPIEPARRTRERLDASPSSAYVLMRHSLLRSTAWCAVARPNNSKV